MDHSPEERHGRRAPAWPWLVALSGALVVAVGVFISGRPDEPTGGPLLTASPSIQIGEIGGAVLTPPPTPDPAPSASDVSTPAATPVLTPGATPIPAATPAATPIQATPIPATPIPATPIPATPEPTAVVAAVGDPADAVALFYGHAVDGDFDAAYALWSDRMKADFPRQDNLDDRFESTAEVTLTQLRTVMRDADQAVVQANFIERYESGSTREFIGYWELVLADGRWLLDQPHY